MESGRFLPIMLGEGGSYFGKDDLFFPLCNCLPDRTVAKRAFIFCQRRCGQFMGELTLVIWRDGWQLRLVELPIGKVITRVKRRPGYEIPGRPGGGLVGRSWADWLIGPIPLGYPGGGSAERFWAGWLLGLTPLGLLGWACWPRVLGLGPRYPQCPPFPAGEEDHPRSKNNKVDLHIIGNSLPLMLLNFQRRF